jgi:putative membrane protein
MNYYYGPMNGYDWGWGVGMSILWFIFLVVIVIFVIRLLRRHSLSEWHKTDPLDIAKERYAKGEITKEQFDQLKKDLK